MSSFQHIKRLCDAFKSKHNDGGPSEARPHHTKRSFTFPTMMLHSAHHRRQGSEGGPLDFSGEPRLGMSPIETLPQEVLLKVFENLVDPYLVTAGFPDTQDFHDTNDEELRSVDSKAICRKDLRNVCFVSRKFKLAATTLLYRCAHLATTESPGNLVLSLAAHPGLQPLVKHISINQCRQDARLELNFNFAFSHDTYNRMFGPLENPPGTIDLDSSWFTNCGEYLRGGLLRLMIPLTPNLRSLVIPQRNLIDGPFTNDLVLHNLTKLRITLTLPTEVLFWVPDVDYSDSVRTTAWLSPDFIGWRFPALQRLEVSTPSSRWKANLTTEETGAWPPLKFVESLTTSTIGDGDMVEWNLMSLERPIFQAPKLHTLIFDGPGEDCVWASNFPKLARWDLNRFLADKGRGLRTLSLDWKCRLIEADPLYHIALQELYFGPAQRLATLNALNNLTHLTVSLQALFYGVPPPSFYEWVEEAEADPDTWLPWLLPPSLKTLRVAEYLPDVYDVDWWRPIEDRYVVDDFKIEEMRDHNEHVYRFLQILRAFWMTGAEGKELWFRRHVDMDEFAEHYQDLMGRDRIGGLLDEGQWAGSWNYDTPFGRVWGLHEKHDDE